jgi:hypothetical protein
MSIIRASLALAFVASALQAQTDFYNTDRGRPLAVEDAVVIERRAFELQAVPLRVERAARGLSLWGIAPELAWGFLPRTQIEVAVPLLMVDNAAAPRAVIGAEGVEIELLHQLNTETGPLPGFALGVGAHIPAGPFGPSRTITALRALATRTLGWGRVHVNASFSPGEALAAGERGAESSRWMAGVAFDRTLALRQTLIGADLTAQEALTDDGAVEWRAGLGLRRQMSSTFAMDAGVFRRLSTGTPGWGLTIGGAIAFARPLRAAPAARGSAAPQSAGAWSTVYHQFYLQASHNFEFRRNYPSADKLFNAFDYGHAILYETLWTRPDGDSAILEGREYEKLTREILNRPPAFPVVENAVEPRYARLAPEAKAMFEWAHLLHRQVYDVLADERLDEAARDRELALLEAYYLSRRDLAFSTKPKNMSLMQEQSYSLAFRQKAPKFLGLMWAYHGLLVGLYEPLLVGETREERQAGVATTVARFRQMMDSPPDGFPVVMPMTGAVAPEFTRRWPTLAIIFDNLHSMHDVISDILANPSVPRHAKRAEILKAAAAFRDDTTEVMTVEGWRRMTEMMGAHNQGGPAVGFLPALPTPTVARGAVMRHDKDGNPIGGHDHH